MDLSFFDDYHKNIHNNMLLLDEKYKDVIKSNTTYNNCVLLQQHLPNEILIGIFSYLPLLSLVACSVACSTFLSCAKNIMGLGKVHIETERELRMLFKINSISDNLRILTYDNTKNYCITNDEVYTHMFPKLRKIIIHVNFPDQLQILKAFNCRKYDIKVITQSGMVREIYAEVGNICGDFELFNKEILCKIN